MRINYYFWKMKDVKNAKEKRGKDPMTSAK